MHPNTPPAAPPNDPPYWLWALLALGVIGIVAILWHPQSHDILQSLAQGIVTTIAASIIAFFLAAILGLLLAMARLSRFIVLRQAAQFYVEIIRGIPMLVLLYYIAFVAAPGIANAINAVLEPLGFEGIRTRDISFFWRAVFALTIGYSAFISEVFRAGIQAVDPGQIEAAKALGLNGWQRFRHIIWPQALRTILPPLGNDFVAMIKDSSLVSALGVADITQLGKLYTSSTFLYFEVYNIVAYIYLVMTLGLSLMLRRLEARLGRKYRR